MPMTALAISRTKRMYEFVQEINHPNLGMCLDTGHANIYRHKPGEMVRAFGKKLFALHVNSNCSTIDEHLIPGIKGI